MSKPLSNRARLALGAKERGVVLFIALIVLVAMSLAGIALSRSVDTTTVVAGNLAFKQSTLQVAEQGIAQATQWLIATNDAAPANLQGNIPAEGFFSSIPAAELVTGGMTDWFDANNWEGAAPGLSPRVLGPDAYGNTVYYVIHRMCQNAGQPPGGANQCAIQQASAGAVEGNPYDVGTAAPPPAPNYYYRVTGRAVGPRNTVSIIQSMVQLPN